MFGCCKSICAVHAGSDESDPTGTKTGGSLPKWQTGGGDTGCGRYSDWRVGLPESVVAAPRLRCWQCLQEAWYLASFASISTPSILPRRAKSCFMAASSLMFFFLQMQWHIWRALLHSLWPSFLNTHRTDTRFVEGDCRSMWHLQTDWTHAWVFPVPLPVTLCGFLAGTHWWSFCSTVYVHHAGSRQGHEVWRHICSPGVY